MTLIFNLLFSLISMVANFFLAPINLIVANAFPDFSNIITIFNNFLSTYVSPALVYFFQILPSGTRNLVLLYLEILLIFYTTTLTIHAAIKVIEIIKAVKIW